MAGGSTQLKKPNQSLMGLLKSATVVGLIGVTVQTQAQVMPNPTAPISLHRQRAVDIFQRIAGVRIPVDDPRLNQMESLLASGRAREAAAIATQDPNFYNITVRDMAARMSTRELTPSRDAAPLSDFVATVVGVTRDETDARQLLHGNFYYKGDPAQVPNLPDDTVADIIRSNNHYLFIQNANVNLSDVLIRRDGQQLVNSANALVAHPDPAGLLTTRAWMAAHAVAGTNRRPVEFTMKVFACIPIEGWADAQSSDAYVGRDVDRYPGGDGATYQTTCKSCHSVMDPFRQAFAYVDFENDYVKHGLVLNRSADPNNNNQTVIKATADGVSLKVNRNAQVFPGGYVTTNAAWVNHAVRGANAVYFGWRGGVTRGTGIGSFGRLVSESQAFSRCMVKKVYRSLCKRDTTPFEERWVADQAQKFETVGQYNLKWLYQTVGSDNACLGKMQ